MRVDMQGWALLLIAVGIAYFIFLKAHKEGIRLLRYTGYAFTVLILVASLIVAVSDISYRTRRQRYTPRTRRTSTTINTNRPRVPQIPQIPQLPRTSVGVKQQTPSQTESTKKK